MDITCECGKTAWVFIQDVWRCPCCGVSHKIGGIRLDKEPSAAFDGGF